MLKNLKKYVGGVWKWVKSLEDPLFSGDVLNGYTSYASSRPSKGDEIVRLSFREAVEALTVEDFLYLYCFWNHRKDKLRDNPAIFRDSPQVKRLQLMGLIRQICFDGDDLFEISDTGRMIAKNATYGSRPCIQPNPHVIPWYKASNGRDFFSVWGWIMGPLVERAVYGVTDPVEVYNTCDPGRNRVVPDWEAVDRIFVDNYKSYPFLKNLHEIHIADRVIRFHLFPERGCPTTEDLNLYRAAKDRHTNKGE